MHLIARSRLDTPFQEDVDAAAAELAEIEDGDTVAIFGCGPVGQFAITSAKLLGAGRIFAIDREASRLEMAQAQGAEIINFDEEDPTEVEAGQYNLNFVKLDGNVGCMVNGAGLAMATMDMIKLSGGEPANFLDVGGSANASTVEAGFRIIMKDPNVKAILMPSDFSSEGSVVDARQLSENLGNSYEVLPISNVFESFGETLKPMFEVPPDNWLTPAGKVHS